MLEFQLLSKIIWRKDEIRDAQKSFCPSFYKEISKREQFFANNFEARFVDANVDNLKTIFLPFYFQEVMSRKDFTLKGKDISSMLIERIANSKVYKFLFIYYKEELLLATLFSIRNNGLYFAYRAFKRDIDKSLKHGATASYWGEKLIFDYGKEHGVEFFSRGKDTHPYFGKSRIGLPLYKLKTGMKPIKPVITADLSIVKFDGDFFMKKGEPVLFFCNDDKKGFYRDTYLFYPIDSLNESYIKEFEKVTQWAGLNFKTFSY